jgi:uncharacterized membrane protein SpoIIM required for sporulation
MKVGELLERRRESWRELEKLCETLQTRRLRRVTADEVTRFASLYRAACADLALADAYQLPPVTVDYLHRLVGQAHNQLYRTRHFDTRSWSKTLLVDTPQRIFRDGCVQFAFCLFWGVFILSAFCAYAETVWPAYAEQILSSNGLEQLETSFSQPIAGRPSGESILMAGFYIRHNTSIGLKCFAGGLLVIPGIFITMYNAAYLGASFGYMARPEVAAGENFFHFVTAHGPFELTAIVLSAAAGLRLGLAWIHTRGWSRGASLQRTASEAMPLMGTAMILFFLAALIEGFLSPSAAPYAIKAAVATLSSMALMYYFVILGYPRSDTRAT